MTLETVALQPVDSAEVTVVVDNSIDILMASTDVARRVPLGPSLFAAEQLRAEHGYALLLTVHRGDDVQSVLYDAGLGRDTAIHNLDVMGVEPRDLRAVVLSHGHADHHAGLEGMVRRIGRAGLPLILHPDAWRERRVQFPTGVEMRLPPPSRADLEREGVTVVDERGPSLLLDDAVLVSGQTERTTDFELGFPRIHQAQTPDGGWEPDPWIWDDQSVSVHVKDKGLVVLSSCSHSGAINVIRHVRRTARVDHLHAFIGGFHLTGGLFEDRIDPTLAALVDLDPDWIVPGHCTGWTATHALARALPDAFIQTSVGTRFVF